MLQSASKVLDSDNIRLNEECKAVREVSICIRILFRDVNSGSSSITSVESREPGGSLRVEDLG